jgi:hypothetical protein
MADDNKPHINMAAAAAGNGPLAPHMLSEIPKRRVGSIGYDSPIKRICILPARRRYKSQKPSDGEARFMLSRRTTGAFYGLYTGSSLVKCIFACSGHRLRSIRRNVPGFSTTYAVLGAISGGGVHGGGVGCFSTTGRKKY